MSVPQLKHPLSVPVKAGLDTLNRLGLRAETSQLDNVDDFRAFSEVLISAHAPTTIGEERINIASLEDDVRDLSISVLKDYLDRCSSYPNIKQMNMHFALKRSNANRQTDGHIGDYGRQIQAINIIAGHAEKHGIEIVLENLSSFWSINGISDETQEYEVDWSSKHEAFGMQPEEWIQICLDVNRENVRLCLDSSHACTYAHRFPESEREDRITTFLSRPDLITHVHWSDNYLYDTRGRQDSHLLVGKGTLPIEFHRSIKQLNATILLEHFRSFEELQEELVYISNL